MLGVGEGEGNCGGRCTGVGKCVGGSKERCVGRGVGECTGMG